MFDTGKVDKHMKIYVLVRQTENTLEIVDDGAYLKLDDAKFRVAAIRQKHKHYCKENNIDEHDIYEIAILRVLGDWIDV